MGLYGISRPKIHRQKMANLNVIQFLNTNEVVKIYYPARLNWDRGPIQKYGSSEILVGEGKEG